MDLRRSIAERTMTGEVKRTLARTSSGDIKVSTNSHVPIVEASPGDAEDFAALILLSSPSLFPTIYGDRVETIVQRLFRKRRNLFSFEHTYFAELGGKKVGMLLGYDWQTKKRENLKTGLLLFREMKTYFLGKLPGMLKAMNAIGMVGDREHYISNLAIYPDHQSMGIGTVLIRKAEEEAGQKGARRMALDVETENSSAIRLYERLGFSAVAESSLRLRGGRSFEFYRMCKEL